MKPDDSAVARWAQELGRVDEREPDWLTVAELAKLAGLTSHTMDMRVKQAFTKGVLDRKTIQIIDGRGRLTETYVYRKLEATDGKASKDRSGTGTHGGGDHQRTRNR